MGSRFFLSLLAIAVRVAFEPTGGAGCAALPACEQRPTNWDAMIDAMANRNPEPDLVKVGAFTLPRFSPHYDWEEQRRVRRAFIAVVRNDDPELWERLVEHLGDRRYALTFRDNGPNARNYSVGNLCRIVAGERLFFALSHRSDPDSRDRPDVYLDVDIDDLAKWRKDRPGKALYELQIEVCEEALKRVPFVERLSGRAKSRIRKHIKEYISQMKSTRRPLFFKVSVGGYEFFNTEEAKAIRDRMKKS